MEDRIIVSKTRQFLSENGFTQNALCAALKLGPSALSCFMNGKLPSLSQRNRVRDVLAAWLADVTSVTIEAGARPPSRPRKPSNHAPYSPADPSEPGGGVLDAQLAVECGHVRSTHTEHVHGGRDRARAWAYEVRRIAAHRTVLPSGVQYLVQWAGVSDAHASWVPEPDLWCPHAIAQYWQGVIAAAGLESPPSPAPAPTATRRIPRGATLLHALAAPPPVYGSLHASFALSTALPLPHTTAGGAEVHLGTANTAIAADSYVSRHPGDDRRLEGGWHAQALQDPAVVAQVNQHIPWPSIQACTALNASRAMGGAQPSGLPPPTLTAPAWPVKQMAFRGLPFRSSRLRQWDAATQRVLPCGGSSATVDKEATKNRPVSMLQNLLLDLPALSRREAAGDLPNGRSAPLLSRVWRRYAAALGVPPPSNPWATATAGATLQACRGEAVMALCLLGARRWHSVLPLPVAAPQAAHPAVKAAATAVGLGEYPVPTVDPDLLPAPLAAAANTPLQDLVKGGECRGALASVVGMLCEGEEASPEVAVWSRQPFPTLCLPDIETGAVAAEGETGDSEEEEEGSEEEEEEEGSDEEEGGSSVAGSAAVSATSKPSTVTPAKAGAPAPPVRSYRKRGRRRGTRWANVRRQAAPSLKRMRSRPAGTHALLPLRKVPVPPTGLPLPLLPPGAAFSGAAVQPSAAAAALHVPPAHMAALTGQSTMPRLPPQYTPALEMAVVVRRAGGASTLSRPVTATLPVSWDELQWTAGHTEFLGVEEAETGRSPVHARVALDPAATLAAAVGVADDAGSATGTVGSAEEGSTPQRGTKRGRGDKTPSSGKSTGKRPRKR